MATEGRPEEGRRRCFCRKIQRLRGFPLALCPAAVAEIFSTAFMILDQRRIEKCCEKYPGLECWLIGGANNRLNGGRTLLHLPKGHFYEA